MSRFLLAVTIAFSLTTSTNAQSDFNHLCGTRTFAQYRMSYTMLWHFIREYENPRVGRELMKDVHGKTFSVNVRIGERGELRACTDGDRSIDIYPENVKQTTIANAACESLKTWKFQQLFWCGEPIEYTSWVVFDIRDNKLILNELTDEKLRQSGPTPTLRKTPILP